MKSTSFIQFPLLVTLLAGMISVAPFALADGHDHSGTAQSATPSPANSVAKEGTFDLAKAIASYPLDTCVVSGDKLEGDMGGPVDFVYQEAGKPDRLVRFCCKNCIKDFKKDPAQYLKKIDEAAAAKAAPSGPK